MSEIKTLVSSLKLGKEDFADFRITEVESTSLVIRKGNVEQVTHDISIGGAARVLINGNWGFYYTTNLSTEGIKAALEKAYKAAKALPENVTEKSRIKIERTYEDEVKLNVKIDPRNISLEEKVKIVLEFDKNIWKGNEEIVTTSVTLSDSVKKEYITNSYGTEVKYEVCSTRISGSAVAKEGDLIQNVSTSVGESRGWETIKEFDHVKEGQELGRRGIELLKALPPPSGRMNIIMDQSLVGVFIHEAFGHASEADAVKANRSILAGLMGKKVGNEAISVTDDPTIPGMRGSYPYDSEGTKAERREIVKKGILVGYLHSLETAAYLNAKPNGAARAMDFSSKPIVRMSNTFIENGEYSLEELAEMIKNGVYLAKSYGGYVDPARGQFYFSAQEGYLIENGKIGNKIQNVSMSGLTLDVLENVVGVGNDLKLAFPGTCGKDGQWVPVSGGGPHIAVKEIVVGGRK
ncbi:MAG: TldD/PmbA family protein [Thermoproteota archaeon]|nr:TldD/PmbA family protein [Candidatus Brockarchaeota archaeon]